MAMVASEHRPPLDGEAVRASLSIWAEDSDNLLPRLSGDSASCEDSVCPSESGSVRSEAQDILDILFYADLVPSSPQQLKDVFATSSPRKAYLAEAVAAGGATGCRWDALQMLDALRAASQEGSLWAPLWLGDLEVVWQPSAPQRVAELRREWYFEAASRGHPDAEDRLAAMPGAAPCAGPCFSGMGLVQDSQDGSQCFASQGLPQDSEGENELQSHGPHAALALIGEGAAHEIGPESCGHTNISVSWERGPPAGNTRGCGTTQLARRLPKSRL